MTFNFEKYHSLLFSQARNENSHSSFGFSQMTAKGHGGACGGQFLCFWSWIDKQSNECTLEYLSK